MVFSELSTLPSWLEWILLAFHFLLSSTLLCTVIFHYFPVFWKVRAQTLIAARMPAVLLCSLIVFAIQTANGWIDLAAISFEFNLAPFTEFVDLITHLMIASMITLLSIRVMWQYQMTFHKAESIWMAAIDLRMDRPVWVSHLQPCVQTWQASCLSITVITAVITGMVVLLDGLVSGFQFGAAWVISLELMTSLSVCTVCWTTIHTTSGIRDHNCGPRHDLRATILGVCSWCVCGWLNWLVFGFGSFPHRLLNHSRNACSMFGYYYLCVKRPTMSTFKQPRSFVQIRRSQSTLSLQSPSQDGTMARLYSVLRNPEEFVLFLQHSMDEFSAEGVIFLVCYMRAKQMLFKVLQNHGMLDESIAMFTSIIDTTVINNIEMGSTRDRSIDVLSDPEDSSLGSAANSLPKNLPRGGFNVDTASSVIRKSYSAADSTPDTVDLVLTFPQTNIYDRQWKNHSTKMMMSKPRSNSLKSHRSLTLPMTPVRLATVDEPFDEHSSIELEIPSSLTRPVSVEIADENLSDENSQNNNNNNDDKKITGESHTGCGSSSDSEELSSVGLSILITKPSLENLFNNHRNKDAVKSPVRKLFNPERNEHDTSEDLMITLDYFGRIVIIPDEILLPKCTNDQNNDNNNISDVCEMIINILTDFVTLEGVSSVNVSFESRSAALKCENQLLVVSDPVTHLGSDMEMKRKVRILGNCMRKLDWVLKEVMNVLKNDSLQRYLVKPRFEIGQIELQS